MSACESWTDHAPILLDARPWRWAFRRRVVLHCIRCDATVGTYPNRAAALEAVHWARMERMRRNGLL